MENCYMKYVMDAIGGKWKLLIIWTILRNEVIRFNELQRQLEGISSVMLSRSLKELEADGLLIRRQYNEVPPRVEYELSELSEKLIIILQSLNEWGREAEELRKGTPLAPDNCSVKIKES